MKRILSLSLLFFVLVINANAQIKEGVIKTVMTYSSDDPTMSATFASMSMNLDVYIKGKKTRTELNGLMTGNNIIIADYNTETALLLIDNPMLGKKFRQVGKEDFDKIVSTNDGEPISITKGTDSKVILGYKCYRWDVKTEEAEIVMWVCDELEGLKPAFNGKLKGTALLSELKISTQGMNLNSIIKVTSIEKIKVDESKFDTKIPEGYTELPREAMGL